MAKTCGNLNVAQRVRSANTIAAIERLARSDPRHAASVSQWDADEWILNTPGGIVELRTGQVSPSDKLKYCTKSTAVAPGGDCPLWQEFMLQVASGDPELVAYIQRACGYFLTGSTREQVLFFLFGTGANGKSVFTGTVGGILADYAEVAPIDTFTATQNQTHPTDVAGLQGARIVMATEIDEYKRWAEAKIKSLTGGDRIAARLSMMTLLCSSGRLLP